MFHCLLQFLCDHLCDSLNDSLVLILLSNILPAVSLLELHIPSVAQQLSLRAEGEEERNIGGGSRSEGGWVCVSDHPCPALPSRPAGPVMLNFLENGNLPGNTQKTRVHNAEHTSHQLLLK